MSRGRPLHGSHVPRLLMSGRRPLMSGRRPLHSDGDGLGGMLMGGSVFHRRQVDGAVGGLVRRERLRTRLCRGCRLHVPAHTGWHLDVRARHGGSSTCMLACWSNDTYVCMAVSC